MSTKLIFLDIDGTLTEAGSNTPPDSALRAIRSAQAKGHKVFLCSGRNYAMLSPLLKFGFEKVIFNDINPEMIEALKNNLEINGISDGYEIFNEAFEDLEFGDADLCVIDAFPGVDVEKIVKKAEKMAENVIVI